VDVGKTDVELRAYFVLKQGRDLVRYQLPRGDGLLGNLQQSDRLQGVIEGLVHRQLDLVGGGQRIHVGCLGAQHGGSHQIVRAPKIGDELRQGKPTGGARIENRVVEIARRDTACLVRLHPRKTSIQGRVVHGFHFPRNLLGSQGQQAVNRNLRIVFQRQGLRVLHREALQRSAGGQLSRRLRAWDGLHLRRRRRGSGGRRWLPGRRLWCGRRRRRRWRTSL